MAYPIATMSDGSVLYSDGKKRKSPNYSPSSGYGAYDRGHAFDSNTGKWHPVDTSYKNKIPASGYGSQYRNDSNDYNSYEARQRRKADREKSRKKWAKKGIRRSGIWSYVGDKRFRSTSDAEKYIRHQQEKEAQRAREEMEQKMREQRRQMALSSLSGMNPFSPGKAYASEYDQGLNYTPVVQDTKTEERPGLFGYITGDLLGIEEKGLSEMFGGRKGSLQKAGKSLNPFQQYVRASITTNPLLGPSVAMTNAADTAFQKWNNTGTVIKGGNAPTEGSSRVLGAYKVASGDSSAPQYTPTDTDLKVGDYTYNKETNQWEKQTDDGNTISASEAMQNELQQILGTNGTGTTDDFFALLGGDEGTQSAITSEKDARDAIIKQLSAQRDALLAQYDSLEGDAKMNAKSKIDELNRQLDLYKTEGQSAKDELSRGYGDLIKQATRGKRMRDLQRRNMFSALGTADSSAFIENQTKADQDFGTSLVNTRRDELNKKTAIDTDISNLEKWTNQSINDISSKLDNYLQQVQASKDLADADKEKLTAEAISNSQQIINQITSEYRNQMYNIVLNQQSMMANMLPNLMQSQQLAEQMKMLEGAGNWRSNDGGRVPAGYMPTEQQSSIPTYTWQDIINDKGKDNQDMGLYAKILRSLLGM